MLMALCVPRHGPSLFSRDESDSTFFHGYTTGFVRDDTDRFGLDGFDSFDSESVAFSWAMLWVLANPERFKSALSITFLFDSMSAIYVGSGSWSSKKQRPISLIAQTLCESLTHARFVSVFHVKAHSGNPLNEFSDRICTAFSRGLISYPPIDCALNFSRHLGWLKWLF